MFKIAWSPVYVMDLPPKHRFPMEKYELLPRQLVYEGTISEEFFFEPGTIKEDYITAIHTNEYWEKLKFLNLNKSEIRRTGFPLSRKLVERECIIAQGTVDCAIHAMKDGISMNIAGGTHHAFKDRGEGFCLLNDVGIASTYLLNKNIAKRILVIDLDVHQGNGTASMFFNDKRVFTFSMHGQKNYPLNKEKSDLDLGLDDHVKDDEYLSKLRESLDVIFVDFNPDFVFYQSGVDVLASDKLGRLSMTMNGCRMRDHIVLSKCFNFSVPMVACMGGGYSEKVTDIVEAHANTYREAINIYF